MKKLFLGLMIISAQLMFAQKTAGLKADDGMKKEFPAKLTKDKINLFNDNFYKFIAAVQVSDRKTIDALLADKVKEIVTDDVLKKVKEGVDPEKKFEVLKVGYYVSMDGVSHPNIKYKYAGDPAAKEVVSAVFDNDGKIVGVMPSKKDQ